MGIGKYLSKIEQEKIQHVLVEAEKTSHGEIVPVIVESSDSYPSSSWQCATWLSLLFSFSFLLFFPHIDPLWVVSLQILVLPIGFFLGTSHAVKKLLISKKIATTEVHQRALEAFLEENIHQTKFRTGILIFVSLLERRAEIICDIGINEKVEPAVWQKIIDMLINEIKVGRLAEGLEKTIRECGWIAEKHFPSENKQSTPNELKNDIIFRK